MDTGRATACKRWGSWALSGFSCFLLVNTRTPCKSDMFDHSHGNKQSATHAGDRTVAHHQIWLLQTKSLLFRKLEGITYLLYLSVHAETSTCETGLVLRFNRYLFLREISCSNTSTFSVLNSEKTPIVDLDINEDMWYLRNRFILFKRFARVAPRSRLTRGGAQGS